MAAVHLGFYNTASSRTHVRFQFSTHAAAGGNIAPSSALENADLRIYKAADGAAFSATQRSSSAGITMTSPFDSLTGFHDVDIDLTDNTDAGFYSAGGFYSVVLAPDETVDGQTLTGVVLAYFEIGVSAANVTHLAGSTIDQSGGLINANVKQISGDADAADAVENAFDNTPGPVRPFGILDRGTAQGVTGTSIQLRSAASFGNDTIIGATVTITSASTGTGQSRTITDYDSATDTATVDAWFVTPTGTIEYEVCAAPPGPATPIEVDVKKIDGSATAAQNQQMYLDLEEFMPVDAHKQKFTISGAVQTVKKPDGTTTAYTKNVGTDAGALPIISST